MTNILYLLLPLSTAWFGVLLRQAFEMERDRRFRRMWGTIAWSLIPFGVSALVWIHQGEVSVFGRNILLGGLGAALGAAGLIWLGYVLSSPVSKSSPQNIALPTTMPPSPRNPPAFAGLDDASQRKLMLERRGQLELAARDAAGTAVAIVFEVSAIFPIKLKYKDAEYSIGVSPSSELTGWIYSGMESAKQLYVAKSAERGKPVDIRSLRPSRGSDTISIGQHAFIELNDGRIAQLILVGAQYYRAGDDKDELRFKYMVYEAGEFLIDAL
jgi:hypothetical protein